MASTDEIITRLRESRPPATDAFTYLTIIEKSVLPAVLPTLHEILIEDVELTRDIGWDLVGTLVVLPGSEKCLETVARLGNPREVLLKVLETIEYVTREVATSAAAEEDADFSDDEMEEGNDGVKSQDAKAADPIEAARQFVVLVSMLAILHKRLVVKSPSKFLHATLQIVARAYHLHAPSSPDVTSAVIQLSRSLSGLKRPPLPGRKSGLHSSLSFFPDPSTLETAKDPEAEVQTGESVARTSSETDNNSNQVEPSLRVSTSEDKLCRGLLRAFVTCVVEGFVNATPMEWAARLLEHYQPQRLVPGRQTVKAAFSEQEELHLRDAMMGELVVG